MSRRAHLRLVTSSEPDDPLALPPVAPVRRDAANDRLPPDFDGFAPSGEAMRPGPAERAGSRGMWAVALASAAAHTALIAAFAMVLAPPGLEAQTDAVSVEIIVEAAPVAQDASAAAGTPGTPETIAAEDVAAERAKAAPVETAEAVPPDMAEAVAGEMAEAVVADLTGPAEPEAMEPASEAEAVEAPLEAATFVPPGPLSTLPETPPVAAAQADTTRVETAIVPPGPAPVLAETAPVFTADPAPSVLQVPPRDDAAAALLAPPPAFPPAEEAPALPAAMETVPLPRPAPSEIAKAKPATDARPAKPAAKQKPTETGAAKKPAVAEVAPKKPAKAAPAAKTATEGKIKAAAKPSKAGGAQGGGGSAARPAAGPGVEAAYARKLFSHLARRQRYPAAAERARVTGTVRLSIAIDRTGALASARIAKGSGSALLDQEALATARRASPYPKPPEGVGGKNYGFAVTLKFDRKR